MTTASVACVVLLGPPGSGKGTQAKRLVNHHSGWVHVSTGDLFRAEISSGSPLGLSVKSTIDAGNLVSDETTNKVFASQLDNILKAKPQTKVLLLDGYPRTKPQAQALVELVRQRSDLSGIKIFEFVASEDLLVERLSGRRINPKTGRIYHLVSNPPAVAGRCDDDGSELVQRADDKPDTIRSRYKLYVKERDGIVQGLQSSLQNVDPVAIDAGLAPDQVEKKLDLAIAEALA